MGIAISSKKTAKSHETISTSEEKRHVRPISGISAISETDSGYRSPEMRNEGPKTDRFTSQTDMETQKLNEHNCDNDKNEFTIEKTFITNITKNAIDDHNVLYQTCFTVGNSDENVFFLNGIDNEVDSKSWTDVNDLKRDSLRNIFIPGAVFNYDKIINDGKANELVARIDEENKKTHKKVKQRPRTAVSTDIEIDLEGESEKIRNKLPTLSKKNKDQNTRDPTVRPRAARGHRQKTVSYVSDDLFNNCKQEQKTNDTKANKTQEKTELSLSDALKILIEQNFLENSNDIKRAYKVDISVDLTSETLKIILPGSCLRLSE